MINEAKCRAAHKACVDRWGDVEAEDPYGWPCGTLRTLGTVAIEDKVERGWYAPRPIAARKTVSPSIREVFYGVVEGEVAVGALMR